MKLGCLAGSNSCFLTPIELSNFLPHTKVITNRPQNKSFTNTSKKALEKQKLNFSRSALPHMKTRVSLKYFVNDFL